MKNTYIFYRIAKILLVLVTLIASLLILQNTIAYVSNNHQIEQIPAKYYDTLSWRFERRDALEQRYVAIICSWFGSAALCCLFMVLGDIKFRLDQIYRKL